MPFEAKAIKHPDTTMEESAISRTAAAVAQEIQDLYNDVENRGGTIVA